VRDKSEEGTGICYFIVLYEKQFVGFQKKTFRLKSVFVRNRVWTVIGEGTVLIDSLLLHREEIKKGR